MKMKPLGAAALSLAMLSPTTQAQGPDQFWMTGTGEALTRDNGAAVENRDTDSNVDFYPKRLPENGLSMEVQRECYGQVAQWEAEVFPSSPIDLVDSFELWKQEASVYRTFADRGDLQTEVECLNLGTQNLDNGIRQLQESEEM